MRLSRSLVLLALLALASTLALASADVSRRLAIGRRHGSHHSSQPSPDESAGNGKCPKGTPIVNCFVDPCRLISTTTCPLGCVSDYCGACNARCACRSDSDCAGMGRCERGSGVSTGAHHARAGRHALGQCSGLATPSAATPAEPQPDASSCAAVLCLTGTTCVDGECRQQCDSKRSCPSGQYCSSSGLCLSAGRCSAASDCDLGAWPRPRCVGYSTCEAGKCAWHCGRPDDEQQPQPEPEPAEPEPLPVDTKCMVVRCNDKTTCVDGKCVPRCDEKRSCPSGSYCNTAGGCLSSGTCRVPQDCARDGDFFHPLCVGQFTCAGGQCGYQCDEPTPEPTPQDKCAVIRCKSGTSCIDGKCLEQCDKKNRCCSGKYCGAHGGCLTSGSCSIAADCYLDPNWVHPLCTGRAVCTNDQCQWVCGPDMQHQAAGAASQKKP